MLCPFDIFQNFLDFSSLADLFLSLMPLKTFCSPRELSFSPAAASVCAAADFFHLLLLLRLLRAFALSLLLSTPHPTPSHRRGPAPQDSPPEPSAPFPEPGIQSRFHSIIHLSCGSGLFPNFVKLVSFCLNCFFVFAVITNRAILCVVCFSGAFLYTVLSATSFCAMSHCFIHSPLLFASLTACCPTTLNTNAWSKFSVEVSADDLHAILGLGLGDSLDHVVCLLHMVVSKTTVWHSHTQQSDGLIVDSGRC